MTARGRRAGATAVGDVLAAPADLLAALSCGAPLAAALALAFRDGGYEVTGWGAASIGLLSLLAAAVMTCARGIGGRLGAGAVAGWLGLAALQGVSGAWADEPAAATAAMNLTLLYAAALALVLVGMRRASWLSVISGAALAGTAVVAVAAVGGRLLPDLIPGDDAARLSAPISYWNGLGALLAVGLVLAVGLAGHPARPLALRATAAGLVPLFALGILLTISRGAAIAAAVALALLVALAPLRLEAAAALVATGLASLPLLVYADGQTGITALSGTLPPHAGVGHRLAIALALSCAVSAAAGIGALRLVGGLRRRRRAAGLGLALTAVLAAAIAIGQASPAGGPVAWADRQVDSFQSFTPNGRADSGTISDRLAVAAGTGRWQNWVVAADEFRASPILGTGAGDYHFRWEADRPIDLTVRNAHSLYLETLGESGVVGLLLLIAPAALGGVAIARALRRAPPALARDLAIAAAAAGVVVLHAGADWDWQLPAVALPAIVLGGAALKAATLAGGPDRPLSAWSRAGLAAACVIAVLLVAGPLSSAARLGEGKARAAAGKLPEALASAQAARRLDPQAPDPVVLEANVLTDLGRAREADAAFAAAYRRSPHDWSILADWSAALLRRGDRQAARVAIARARRLNPREARLALLAKAAR